MVYAAAVESGAADPARTQVPTAIKSGELLGELLGGTATTFPPQWVGILINALSSLRGYLMAETLGSLRQLIGDSDRLYDAHLRTVMLGLGFDPARVDAIGSDDRT